jgi:hypothetical protein
MKTGIKAGGGSRWEGIDQILRDICVICNTLEAGMATFKLGNKPAERTYYVDLEYTKDSLTLYIDGKRIVKLRNGKYPICIVEVDTLVKMGISHARGED